MKKLLIIGYVWPEPKSSAAGIRMMQMIHLFKKENYDITFASPAQLSEYMADLSSINVSVKKITLNCDSFNEFCKELSPDIVLYDRFMMEEQFGWRVTKSCANAMTILDTEDLHSLRFVRQQCYKKNIPFSDEEYLSADITKREIASIYRSDLTLMISKTEIELLQRLFQIPLSKLFLFPFVYHQKVVEKQLPSFNERSDFMTIGNFLHQPNWDAVLHLKQTIWPAIKKQLPKAKLHVYGAYPSEKVYQLHNTKEGFLIHGRADDVDDVMQKHKVCISPLRFGAGIKGKFIDAMRNGTPSVTSTIGSEDMIIDNLWGGFVADDPNEFAEKALNLYTDEKIWNEKQKAGNQLFKKAYQNIDIETGLTEKIIYIGKNLKTHRNTHFLGEILKHHTLNSTIYMSKWIQEKNK